MEKQVEIDFDFTAEEEQEIFNDMLFKITL